MSRRKAQPIIVNKEDGNFREALKLYEAKSYKKSLKLTEQILKKNSSYTEALALKALNLYYLNQFEESELYVTKTLSKDSESPVVNHILGILRRSQKSYKQAGEFFAKALENGSTNKQIWRDLSVMQLQTRDYKTVAISRHAYLDEFLGYRANWTALAVAHHLNKDYNASEKTLTKFEELAKGKLGEAELFENSELELYKNQIIYESGDVSRALEELTKLDTFDKLSELEYKGKYLLELGKFKEASKVYRILLKRNPDNFQYYDLLETSLQTKEKSLNFRDQLYQKLARFYPKSDAPKFIPLTFLKGELFETRAKSYIINQLERGVPATFTNVKPLYKNPAKVEIVEKIVLEFFNNLDSSEKPLIWVWTSYFLSQHYLHLHKLNKAKEFIDNAIEHTPTLVELYLLKARILKHFGDAKTAAEVINQGRLLDLQDRFVNSKTVKYYLRDNDVDKAVELISLFTKNDSAINGLKDLHTMQCTWFLIENGESYLRLYEKALKDSNHEDVVKYGGLALKRFKAIVKIFEEYYDDQLDFHSFCTRRGTARSYIDMLKWEDEIFSDSVYVRALQGAFKIYTEEKEEEGTNEDKQTEAQHVKNKKSKLKQLELEKNKLIAYTDDKDVFGAKLYQVEDSIKTFQSEFLANNKFNKFTNSVNELEFKLNLKLNKIPLAINSLIRLKNDTLDKYEYLPYYYLLLKLNGLKQKGLIQVLTDRAIEKNFPSLTFDDALVDTLKPFDTFAKLDSLVKIINLKSENIDNDEFKKALLSEVADREPLEQYELLKELK